MERSIRWTPRALARLDEIGAYIAKDNPQRAQSFVLELRSKVEALKRHQFGTAGRVYGTKELVLHANYVAVYRIQGPEVQILTILHAAQRQ